MLALEVVVEVAALGGLALLFCDGCTGAAGTDAEGSLECRPSSRELNSSNRARSSLT
jgi:hypothetical protein